MWIQWTAGGRGPRVLCKVKCHPALGTIDTEIPAQVSLSLSLSLSPGLLVTSIRSGVHWVTHWHQMMGTSRVMWPVGNFEGLVTWRQDFWGMITNGNTRDQRTGNSQRNPNPGSVCEAFESRRKVNIVLLASQTHELSAAETRPGYRSCIPPSPLLWRIYKCPCGKPIAGGRR